MSGRFANIIVDISHENVDRPFQYIIPDDMRDKLTVGMAVKIPFGKGNKLIKGYVIELTDQAEYDVTKLKYINAIDEDFSGTDSDYIKLAVWIKNQYGSTLISALKTVLPVKEKTKVQIKKTIILKAAADKAYAYACDFEAKHMVAKSRLLKQLCQTPQIPWALATGKLGITVQTINSLINAGYIEVISEDAYRRALPKDIDRNTIWKHSVDKALSQSQQMVVDTIVSDMGTGIHQTYLLHGVTGSGKTEVYMEVIADVISKGYQAIVLIPEISLTYQTLIRFYNRFGDRVSVMNSKLSKGERSDQMERAKNGDIDIVIGPRSALFTPFKNLGVIIIDEEHEASYKSESMPKYHAREVATQICNMKNASLILGSATPSVESYYRAQKGEIKLLELNERISGGQLPKVYVEDLRQELKSGNRSIFSRRLHNLMEDRLSKGEQTILFINRRGYAGFVSCRSCGYVVKCPHCDVSLSEHTDRYRKTSRLVCHYCGYEAKPLNVCPQCGSKYIMGFKAGTQQIEELLNKEFPTVRVLRMDADTTRSKDGYDRILSQFANNEADILVGTQMIVKGHDFANVTLVGVLAADLSMHAGDYRAGERTFQLLTQAAGRAGRSTKSGEVVIQTYQPDNYTIVHAANQDYKGFYEEELSYRDLMMYPPVAHMMAVLVMSNDEITGKEHIGELADRARARFGDVKPRIIGPAPASVGKINDVYRYIFYVKHREYGVLVDIKDYLENLVNVLNWNSDSVQFDFNPMNSY